MTETNSNEVFIEYTKIGKSVRVTAIDADTGLEVTFQAPVTASTREMERVAIRKLNYVLRKQKQKKP